METTTNVWEQLLGTRNLRSHDNNEGVAVSSLSSFKTVLLYFSAHWCPPCRDFTPKLSTFYTTHNNEKNFTVVFISSDRDEESFEKYYGGEHPWLALDYCEREVKNKLSAKYKVEGIPSLVVLNGEDAVVITTNGREKVSGDVDAVEFPWYPESFTDIFTGVVVNKEGKDVDCVSIQQQCDVLGIYFSAHWCPPCKIFTPKLVETYNKIKADGKSFEIIFASSDRDEKSFNEYYEQMPWLALPLGDKRKKRLSELYNVSGIPAFIVLDPKTGKTINATARSSVTSDPEGVDFPWHPKAATSIDAAGGELNTSACFMFFHSEQTAEHITLVKTIGEKYWKQWADQDDKPLNFFWGTTGKSDMIKKIKDYVKQSADPLVMILDLPSRKIFVMEGEEYSEATFTTFVDGFVDGTLVGIGI